MLPRLWILAAAVLAAIQPSPADDAAMHGLLSFEQECRSGVCPDTLGPASCVCAGYTAAGDSLILTARHCTDQQSNRFYVVTARDEKVPATLLWRSPDCDIAALVLKGRRMPAARIRLSDPQPGEAVVLTGLLSRRYQESKGAVTSVEPSGRVWFRGIWSHSGMSGGPIYDSSGRLFAIHHSKVVGEDRTIGASGAAFRAAIQQFERRFGKLQLPAGSITTQQGVANRGRSYCAPCQAAQPNICGPCNAGGRPVDIVSAQVAIPRPPAIDYDQLAAQFFQQYGERLRGADGRNGVDGRDGERANVDLNELAALMADRYADQLRGRPGQPGRDGLAGPPGPRGLVGVPDNEDIRNWLIGASADPQTREQLAVVFADVLKNDPRVESLIQRLQAVEQSRSGTADLSAIYARLKIVEDWENRVVPVQVFNSDGTEFGEPDNRKLFDPIEIELLPPENK